VPPKGQVRYDEVGVGVGGAEILRHSLPPRLFSDGLPIEEDPDGSSILRRTFVQQRQSTAQVFVLGRVGLPGRNRRVGGRP